ncbi:MAG: hypothetical protein WCD79_09640 [Chthoniobacteraceae bacterium]
MGEFSLDQIPRLRRTKKYVASDYWLIKRFFDLFPLKVTTPNILTEISNLSGDVPGELKSRFFDCLSANFKLLGEHYVPSKTAAASPIFSRFGLTDATLLELAETYLVVTDDFPLSNYLTSIKADVINFNHLRFQT